MVVSLAANHEAIDWITTLLATSDYAGEVSVVQSPDPDWPFQVQLVMPESRRMAQILLDKLSPLERSQLISAPEIDLSETKPDDLPPFVYRVGDRFVISRAEVPEPLIGLKIDPMLTFGSGFHPATQLCLKLIEKHVQPGSNCLDLGCGSGILSIAIAKLGAQVLALDNDHRSVEATQAAVDRNQVASRVTVQSGSLGQGSTLGHWMGGETTVPATDAIDAIAQFDLIAANILARIHIALAEDYARSLRPNGLLITAGYTAEYVSELETTFAKVGLHPVDQVNWQEWTAIAYRAES